MLAAVCLQGGTADKSLATAAAHNLVRIGHVRLKVLL
jgi:hypothetical protein